MQRAEMEVAVSVRYGRCPICGRPLQSDQARCPGCDADLNLHPILLDALPTRDEEARGPRWRGGAGATARGLAGGLVLALAVAALAALWWRLHGGYFAGVLGRGELLAVVPCWLLAAARAAGERVSIQPAAPGGAAGPWRRLYGLRPWRPKSPDEPRPALALFMAGLPPFAAALLFGSG